MNEAELFCPTNGLAGGRAFERGTVVGSKSAFLAGAYEARAAEH